MANDQRSFPSASDSDKVYFSHAVVQHVWRSFGRHDRTAVRDGPSHCFDSLHDAPNVDDGELLEETPLEELRRATWAVLSADDSGRVSRSPDSLARMMAVVIVTCQDFVLTVSETKTESIRLWSAFSSTDTHPGHQRGRSPE